MENSGRFKPGHTGNPNGAPNRKLISDALNLELSHCAKKGDHTNARKIAMKLVQNAIAGDTRAAEIIFERVEGKVAQTLNVNIEDAFSRFLGSLGTTTPEVRAVEDESKQLLN